MQTIAYLQPLIVGRSWAMLHPDMVSNHIKDRGYCMTYHPWEINRCPGCGGAQWYVGRMSAECGFCATVLMFAAAGRNRSDLL